MHKDLSIHLQSVSKKYGSFFLYKNLNLDIYPNDKLVITGNNGSGKSTLLKIIAGFVNPTDGKVLYNTKNGEIEKRYWYKYISIAAPYMNVIEEFTSNELVSYLMNFRQFQLNKNEMLELLELDKHLNKPIKQFSSGMKQKVRLLLAITDIAPVLLLDEPLSNLDASAGQWYQRMIQQFAFNKTILVFSNSQKEEYVFCERHFSLSEKF